jgi:REP element-mobilizing transposase RayT
MIKQRKQIRLINYDYSQSGLYFVTICTQNRENVFGKIVGARRDSPKIIEYDRPVPNKQPVLMVLNQYGKIVDNIWKSLPNHHMVGLDVFQIMPNHIHFILHIIQGASRRAPTTLGFIIGMFKTECTKQINKLRNTPGQKIFQRNYYEHIIHNENELTKIRQYIKNNPTEHV